MDNLTHTLTGLMLSRAGLNRLYPRASLVLILAANVPDIDFVAIARGPLFYFEQHRGITHSIAALPVMALLPVLIACAIGRSMRGWRAAWGISMIGVASHLLLDLTNTYGIRLLLPFSAEWFHLDLISLFDLIIWAVLLLGWLGPMLGKLVSGEMGAQSGSGRGLAIFALSFFLVYDFGRYLAHQRAVDILNSRVYRGGPPIRVAAFPGAALSPFAWDGWVERPDVVLRFSVNLLREFDPTAGRIIYKQSPTSAIAAARTAAPVRVFLQFAQYPLWSDMELDHPEHAHDVELRDWRFPFAAQAIIDSSNRVISSSFHY
ncbi:MAG TPA: metal-dependent hydrolase [Bryobacteraceae bacterium]|nr:metal-dependent hydrolase [Bryobacteraceae bacterium]